MRDVICRNKNGRGFKVRVGINGAKVLQIPQPPKDAESLLRATGVPVVENLEAPRIGGSIGEFGPYMPNDGYVWDNEDDVRKMNGFCEKIREDLGFS